LPRDTRINRLRATLLDQIVPGPWPPGRPDHSGPSRRPTDLGHPDQGDLFHEFGIEIKDGVIFFRPQDKETLPAPDSGITSHRNIDIIARDTVEEKVLALQESKREIADAIIREDNSLLSSLAPDDLALLLD